jgi:ABC-type nitrate/sulfonate/bicarbonate transport system ATPase subunit
VVMSSRPGSIDFQRDIPLPRPRTEAVREQDDYFHLIGEIRSHLRSPDGVHV